MATPLLVLERVCAITATAASTTIAILAPRTADQAELWWLAAETFQIPVKMRTTKAGHWSRAKARAAVFGAPSPSCRRVGTKPATVSCPPTQIVAARTWIDTRNVVPAGAREPTAASDMARRYSDVNSAPKKTLEGLRELGATLRGVFGVALSPASGRGWSVDIGTLHTDALRH